MKKKYAADFDGTLAEYHGWKGIEHTGAPVPEMVNRVRTWLAQGHEVSIYTARLTASEEFSAGERDIPRIKEVIQTWCERHIGCRLPVTNIKGGFNEFWDDRAVHVVMNTGLALHEHVEDILWRLYRTAQLSANYLMMSETHNAIHEIRSLVDKENDE